MKTGKKLLALLLTSMMIFSATSCGVQRTEEVDENKTTLYVGNIAGGIRDEWLKKAIARFEEKYDDTSFEEGKKGVQVLIADNNRTTMHGETLKDTISTSKTEVFFTEAVFYYNWVQRGLLHDLTDVVNEDLTEYGEDKSIADKMDANNLEAMTVDGKIYALPFWEGYYGFVYNATLFDENSWYFAADGSFTNATGTLSNGPDGKSGTYDDGMPATYDQFFQLLTQINEDNAIPIQWAGASPDYLAWTIGALFADYEGYDDFMLNYTLSGTDDLVKMDTIDAENLSYETESVEINSHNGYELARQEGLLYAVDFAAQLLRGNGFYDVNTALSGSFKQQDAQLAFVRNTSLTSSKPVAIMIDGSWWENEADNAFAETYGTGATKYDSEMEYKWMPFPKANESKIGSENLIVSPLDSYCFINANIADEKKELAEAFIQFCHTDESLEEFTATTGMKKPYNYEVDDSQMTSFGKSVLEVVENSRVVFPKSNNELYVYSSINFRLANLMASMYDNDKQTTNMSLPLTEKRDGEYTYDFMDYYKGILSYRENTLWSTFGNVLK